MPWVGGGAYAAFPSAPWIGEDGEDDAYSVEDMEPQTCVANMDDDVAAAAAAAVDLQVGTCLSRFANTFLGGHCHLQLVLIYHQSNQSEKKP